MQITPLEIKKVAGAIYSFPKKGRLSHVMYVKPHITGCPKCLLGYLVVLLIEPAIVPLNCIVFSQTVDDTMLLLPITKVAYLKMLFI